MFEIENIDIMTIDIRNPRASGGKGVARSPFGKALCALKVGHAFVAPDSFGKSGQFFSNRMHDIGKRLGRKFSMRRVEGGYRIGRVA